MLPRADHLGVTVPAEHHDTVARQLAGRPDTRFDDLDLTFGPGGAVTLAWFDTTIDRYVEAGDHTIVLLRLHAEHSRPWCSTTAAST